MSVEDAELEEVVEVEAAALEEEYPAAVAGALNEFAAEEAAAVGAAEGLGRYAEVVYASREKDNSSSMVKK